MKVEVAPQAVMHQSWDGWTVTSTNLSRDASLAADGTISYGFEGKRRAGITLAGDVTFYSIPDRVILDFSTTTTLNIVKVDLRTPSCTGENLVELTTEEMPVGHYQIDLLEYLDSRTDLINFPLSIHSITYSPRASGYIAGDNTITQKLYAVYDHYSSGVEAVEHINGRLSIFPAANGAVMVGAAGIDVVEMSIYGIAGNLVTSRRIDIAGGTATVHTGLPAGIYVVKVQGGDTSATAKLVIK